MRFISWIIRLGQSIWAMRRFIGNGQHMFLSDLHRIWGDNFSFLLGTRKATVMAHPDAIREIFEQSADILSASESRRRLVGVLPPNSIPYQSGGAHQRARRALAQAFSQTCKGYSMDSQLDELIAMLRDGSTVADAVESFCYDLASRFVFGKLHASLKDTLRAAVQGAKDINPIVLGFPWLRRIPGPAAQFRRLQETRDAYLATLEGHLEDHDSRLNDDCLAGSLLRIGTRMGMSRLEIRDNLGMIAMATAFNLRIVLINAIHALADNPDWQQRLRNAERRQLATASSLSRAMIQESLRVSPVVPLVSRMVRKDVLIAGVQLRAGQIVFASPWITHFREDAFDHPHEYDPSRFLSGQRHGFNFIPFGGGASQCLGGGWSINLAAAVIRRVSRDLRLHGDHCEHDASKFSYEVFNLVRRSSDARVATV